MPIEPFVEDECYGLDLSTTPDQIGKGFFQRLDNVMLDGTEGSGGTIRTRYGRRGVLLTNLVKPIRNAINYRKADGIETIVFVCGAETDGEIRYWEKGDDTTTLLGALGTFDATKTYFAVVGEWVYMNGNLDGILRRTNLTTSGTAEGLDAPDYTLSPFLQSESLIPVPSSAGWTPDTGSGAYTATINGEFATGSGASDADNWVFTGAVERYNTYIPGVYAVRLDDYGSYITSEKTDGAGDAYPNIIKANTNGVGSTVRRPVHFLADFGIYKDNQDDSRYVKAGVIGYTSTAGTTEVGRLTRDYEVPQKNVLFRYQDVFSLAGLVQDNEVVGYNFVAGTGDDNPVDTDNPYMSYINLEPFVPIVNLTGTEGGMGIGVAPYGRDATKVYIGEQRIATSLTSTDFADKAQISIRYRAIGNFDAPRIKLGFRTGNADAPVYSNDLTIYTDTDGQQYLTTDISNLPDIDLTAITRVELYFAEDITLNSGENTGQAILVIGDITEAGNLSVGYADYDYVVVERDPATGIESPNGAYSIQVTPTPVNAQTRVIFGAGYPTNPGATIDVYRRGGTFVNGYAYLAASFASGGNATGTNWSWDEATQTFYDNIPDTQLLGATLLISHSAPPLNLVTISEHEGRLAGATEQVLYLSQLRVGNAAGLYFNLINLPDSPDRSIEGFTVPIVGQGGNIGDRIIRLLSYNGRLFTFLFKSIYMLLGKSVVDYYLRKREYDKDIGIAAPKAAEVFKGAIFFLAKDGLRIYSDGEMPVVSGRIAKGLNPVAVYGDDDLPSEAYQQCSIAIWDRFLLLFAPKLATDTGPEIAWCRDNWRPGGGWTRLLLSGMYGGVTIGNELFVYGTDGTTGGMLFAFGPDYGDSITSGATVTTVSAYIRSRQFHLSSRARNIIAERLGIVCQVDDDPDERTIHITVTADGSPTRVFEKDYILQNGLETIIRRMKVNDNVRGSLIDWEIDCSSMNPFGLTAVLFQCTEGKTLL